MNNSILKMGKNIKNYMLLKLIMATMTEGGGETRNGGSFPSKREVNSRGIVPRATDPAYHIVIVGIII